MAGTSNSSSSSDSKDSRWYFTAEQLANSPSRRHGIDADQELSYRQLTAYLIQEMGQRLQVSQLCINTAIVYMHRFYAFHSFTHFHRNGIAAASLFLAAKVEEQPRKLEHVIKVAHICLSQDAQPSHPSPELYVEQAQDLVFNENVLLQTLGFDVAIDHPHTHVVKTCHLVKACKDLAQTSYFLASNSLHLTPMCLQYRPTVVACFCIYLACKWSRWEIPQSTEGKHWFHYVDKTVTMDLLKQLTDEFIVIYEKSPARLKSKLNSIKALAQGARISEPSRPIPESSGNASASAQPETQRRPESIPSHHRTHHSSSHSGSSHHHSKQILSTDGGDHINKSNQLHKPHTSSSHLNRPRQERPERSDRVERSDRPDRPERTERTDRPIIAETQIPPHPSVRPINPAGSMRPTNVNRPGHPMLPVNLPPPSQRPIHPHDPAYHKNRYPNTALKPKSTDPQRHMMKEPTGRPMDPNKTSVKHPNSAYTTQNVNPGTIDMSRTGMSAQGPTNLSSRSYIPPNNMQPPNYNLTGPVRSSSSNSNNINTSNMKYEQSVQQQTPLQNTQKQSSESSFSTASFKQNEDILKHEQMELCSPTRTTFVPPSQTTHLGSAKSGSMFSPEWNVPSSLNPTLSNNGNTGSFKQINQNNMKMSRDSPKKSDREKRSETPKKDKIRNEMMGQDMTKSYQPDKRNVTKKISDNSANTSSQSNINMQFENKGSMSVLGTKRPFSNLETVVKSEDDFLRDCKARKLDNLSPSRIILPFPYDNSGTENVKCNKPFTSTINGTETNPDFVSSLLKESLCSESKLSEATAIKNEPFMELEEVKPTIQQSFSVQQQSFQHQPQQNQPSYHQPSTNIQNPTILYQQQQQHLQMVQQQQQQQQQAISMTQRDESISQYKQNLQHQQQHILPQQEFMLDYSMVKAEQGSIIHQATQQQIDTQAKDIQIETASDEYSKSKSEKKKKKDKHKHKEKEKSKDKEEKKKHKKEKDKHKERDRSSGNEQEQNPVKIKIPKDKLNLPPTDPQIPPVSGFKIKIPKDKIKKELGSTYATEESSTTLTVTQPPPSSLKIKISKDKIENYSHHPHSSSSNYHSHGSAKKKDKDRDRERDKEKKKSSEFNKQNGNNGSNNGAGGPSGTSVTKSQSSNSNKEIWVNS